MIPNFTPRSDSFKQNPSRKVIRSAHDNLVQVAHTVNLKSSGIHEIVIEARVGSIRQSHVVTIGPDDSSGFRHTPPTTEQIQAMLDDHKLKLIDEVSWKHSVTKSLDGLK